MASARGLRDRLPGAIMLAVLAALMAGLAFGAGRMSAHTAPRADAGGASVVNGGGGPADTHAHMHGPASATPVRMAPEATVPCRPGAFLEADRIVATLTHALRELPATTPEAAHRAIDVALHTGLMQAHAEVHCVAGLTSQSYGREFAETIRGGVAMARSRAAPPAVLTAGEEAAQALEQGQLMDKPLPALKMTSKH